MKEELVKGGKGESLSEETAGSKKDEKIGA